MKRLKWLATILGTIAVSILPAVAVSAANPLTVTMVNTPQFTNGISSFTVTYVSDTEMDLNWTLDTNYPSTAQNIMIRAKYGQYPADTPDENTMPSDGYLVYYGDGLTTTSAVDTSMDFSENAGSLYYKAWAQKVDGTWYTTTNSGSEESRDVILATLLGVLALAAIAFTIAGYTKHQPTLGLLGAMFFLFTGGFAATQTLTTWDIWYDLMFVGFLIGGLVAMISFGMAGSERKSKRVKAAADKAEATRPRTQQELWDKSQQDADDLYMQTHLPRANRHHQKKAS